MTKLDQTRPNSTKLDQLKTLAKRLPSSLALPLMGSAAAGNLVFAKAFLLGAIATAVVLDEDRYLDTLHAVLVLLE